MQPKPSNNRLLFTFVLVNEFLRTIIKRFSIKKRQLHFQINLLKSRKKLKQEEILKIEKHNSKPSFNQQKIQGHEYRHNWLH